MAIQSPTSSEQFIYDMARRSFLCLWSYLSPQGKAPNKELCDILIVCEPHVIIISVKDIKYKDTGRPEVDWKRWEREAVAKSIDQIEGAERWLNRSEYVIRQDGVQGLPLPHKDVRVYHRIAVAFGGEREVPVNLVPDRSSLDGFIHVFDETSAAVLMQELDTINDFIKYLTHKEELFCKPLCIVAEGGGEEDLLAVYLHNNRTFPDADMMMLKNDLWEGLQRKAEFKARKRHDSESYVWDKILDRLAQDILHDNLEISSDPSQNELVARTMALEDRFSRRLLGKAFKEFIVNSTEIRSRCLQADSGVNYVFLASDYSSGRESRVSELGLRCQASINRFPANTIVGIGTEILGSSPKPGYSLDFVYMHADEWSGLDLKKAKDISDEFGYFKTPKQFRVREDEYPKQK